MIQITPVQRIAIKLEAECYLSPTDCEILLEIIKSREHSIAGLNVRIRKLEQDLVGARAAGDIAEAKSEVHEDWRLIFEQRINQTEITYGGRPIVGFPAPAPKIIGTNQQEFEPDPRTRFGQGGHAGSPIQCEMASPKGKSIDGAVIDEVAVPFDADNAAKLDVPAEVRAIKKQRRIMK